MAGREGCSSELNEDRQREAVLARCRAQKVEPPGRMDRIIGAANRLTDNDLCGLTPLFWSKVGSARALLLRRG